MRVLSRVEIDNQLKELGFYNTKYNRISAELRFLLNNQPDDNVVIIDDCIRYIYGRVENMDIDEIKDKEKKIKNAFSVAKKMQIADEGIPLMKVRFPDNGRLKGFKVQTSSPEDLLYIKRNLAFRTTYATGWLNGTKLELEEAKETKALDSASVDVKIGDINDIIKENNMIPQLAIVDDGCFELRQEILARLENGIISRRDADYELSEVCK